MNETVLLGRGQKMIEIPRKSWQEHLSHVPQHATTRLAFMTEAHHRVRYFVVSALPRVRAPIPAERIAQQLDLPLDRVAEIVDELERNLFFLSRDEQGAVTWAFPVTVEPTPHQLLFDTGERLYGA